MLQNCYKVILYYLKSPKSFWRAALWLYYVLCYLVMSFCFYDYLTRQQISIAENNHMINIFLISQSTLAMCRQQMPRPACALAPSAQGLCFLQS